MLTVDYNLADVQFFLLIFFRMTGLFVTAPVFGSGQIPPMVKIWLSFVMAWVMVPLIDMGGLVIAPNVGSYLLLVVAELGIGVILGLGAQLLFTAVQMGGLLIGQEMGLTMANVLDPITNSQTSILGQFKLLLAILIYLSINGHHVLIRAITESFGAIPVGGLVISQPLATLLTDTMVVEMMQVSLQVAAPAMVSLFLVTLALGFMARTVPEMNIFAVGFALRLLIGFFVLAIAIPVFRWVFLFAYEKNVFNLDLILQLMAG